jgi:hypothetical protein
MKFAIRKFKSNTVGGLILNAMLASAALLVLLLLYFYAYLPATTNHGETITVPSIEGMQISQLQEFLIKRTCANTLMLKPGGSARLSSRGARVCA